MDPDLTSRLADETLRLLLEAESALLERVAAAVGRGIDAPGWAERQALELARVRQELGTRLAVLEGEVGRAVGDAVGTAAVRGQAAAAAEVAGVLDESLEDAVRRLPGGQAVRELAAESVGQVRAMFPRILRAPDDVFRAVQAEASATVLGGARTRREAAQSALNAFARRGVTGFVDRAGRRWDMASYAEMSVRTVTQRAATQAHSVALQGAGLDLVIVSDAPQECETCRPWEGRVLSLSGSSRGTVAVESVVGAGMVRVRVAGSLREATRAGLYHPGCRHSHSAYLPGATRAPAARSTPDPAGDAARQRLRALERRLRAARRQQVVALDDTARRAAGARVRDAQASIRQHVASTTAKRQRAREQIVRAR